MAEFLHPVLDAFQCHLVGGLLALDGHQLVRTRSDQLSLGHGTLVRAGAADGRKHFIEHPGLELLSGRHDAVDDQAKRVTLREDASLLGASKAVEDGVVFHHPTAMLLHGIGSVGIAEQRANILAHKPRLAVLVGDDANRDTFKAERHKAHVDTSGPNASQSALTPHPRASSAR